MIPGCKSLRQERAWLFGWNSGSQVNDVSSVALEGKALLKRDINTYMYNCIVTLNHGWIILLLELFLTLFSFFKPEVFLKKLPLVTHIFQIWITLKPLRTLSNLVASLDSIYRIFPKLNPLFPKHTISPGSFPTISPSFSSFLTHQHLKSPKFLPFWHSSLSIPLAFAVKRGHEDYVNISPPSCLLQQRSS